MPPIYRNHIICILQAGLFCLNMCVFPFVMKMLYFLTIWFPIQTLNKKYTFALNNTLCLESYIVVIELSICIYLSCKCLVSICKTICKTISKIYKYSLQTPNNNKCYLHSNAGQLARQFCEAGNLEVWIIMGPFIFLVLLSLEEIWFGIYLWRCAFHYLCLCKAKTL